MDTIKELTVRTVDGRELAVQVAGPAGAPLVLVHEGTPSRGVLDPEWVAVALAAGLRTAAYSRPGYRSSTPQPGRRVADAASDAAAVADALGAETFSTWGVSGGGPHALACAALLPDRVFAVALVASLAPPAAEGLDWTAGMGQENVEEFAAARAGDVVLRDYLDDQRATFAAAADTDDDGPEDSRSEPGKPAPGDAGSAGTEPGGVRHDAVSGGDIEAAAEGMATLLPPPDLAFLLDPAHGPLIESFVGAVEDGVEGWLEDDLAFCQSWGFDLPSGEGILLLQGGLDLMVPPGHGHWLAAAMPAADVRLIPDLGHLSLLTRYDEVARWLAGSQTPPWG